jgi:hypothetical protein
MGYLMKNLVLFPVFLVVLAFSTYGQVTNLLVNNTSSGFTMASGGQFSWSYNVPNAGDTTLVEIWIDTDHNGVLNPAVDVLWTYFNQVDGDTRGQNGPPDGDGLANKFVSLQQNLGLAPASYIMVFKNHNSYKSIAGTITPLASPTFTISGTVTVPTGISKANIMLSLNNQGSNQGNTFWNAITDLNGNFSIKMNSDTSGNPWILNTNNNIIFGSAIVEPSGDTLRITPGTATYANNNFTVKASSAVITGTVRNEFGAPFISWGVQANSTTGNFFSYVQTDTAGVFKIGFLSTDLPQSNIFVGSGTNNNNNDTNFVTGMFEVTTINSGDTKSHDITIFKTNSTISGRITLNGNAPNYNMQIICLNADTGFVMTNTDINGNYIFHVSNKIYNYSIGVQQNNLPPGYVSSSITAHAGQTNVNLNITLSGVKSGISNIPEEFSLSQNYPNPFNPTTTINYSVAKEGQVKLTVYNSLGGKVATLVSENKPAGNYSVQFNASKLASGIYLYKLESGNFTAEKKLILLK